MRMAELMREISKLSPADQNQLAAYFVHLRVGQDPRWRAEMAHRIDDSDSANWITLQDWKKELGANPET